MDSGPQFSQSVGGIVHDGEYTPVMSTNVSRDTGLIDLKVRAREYGSIQSVMKESGITSSVAKANQAQGLKNLIPLAVAIPLFLVGLIAKPFPTFNENSIFGLSMAVVAFVLIFVSISRSIRASKSMAKDMQSLITPAMRDLAARRERGSYCMRCNVFSPEHI
jgi:hypothetical protein